MITGKTCANCAAFSALTNECRRHSPAAVLVPQPGGKAGSVGVYPSTGKDGWCFEFVPEDVEKA